MRCVRYLFGLVSLCCLVTTLYAQDTPSKRTAKAPEMNVSIFLGTETEVSKPQASAELRAELLKVFGSQKFRHVYPLGVQSLRFKNSNTGVVQLPDDRKAFFDFKGVEGQHHLFELRLPAFGISATLHIPLNRVFYQAGIRHAGGTLILRIRTTPTQ